MSNHSYPVLEVILSAAAVFESASLLIRESRWESSQCKGIMWFSPRISVVDAAVSSASTISHSRCLSLTVGCTVFPVIRNLLHQWKMKELKKWNQSEEHVWEICSALACCMKLKCPWIMKPKALLISKGSWWVLSYLRSGDSLIQCYKREFVCPPQVTFAQCPAPCDVIQNGSCQNCVFHQILFL